MIILPWSSPFSRPNTILQGLMCAFRSSQKKFGESLPSQIKTHPPPLIIDGRAIHIKIDMVPQIKTKNKCNNFIRGSIDCCVSLGEASPSKVALAKVSMQVLLMSWWPCFTLHLFHCLCCFCIVGVKAWPTEILLAWDK